MPNNQSITDMTLQDLESLINRIVDEKINKISFSKDKEVETKDIESQRVIQELFDQYFEKYVEPQLEITQKALKTSDPFVQFDGIFKDDPFFDEFVEEMAKNRRELDAEMAAY